MPAHREATGSRVASVGSSEKIREGANSFREAGGDRAYFGDPAGATAAEGESTLDTLASILVTAIREFSS